MTRPLSVTGANFQFRGLARALAAATLASALISGCAPLLLGGAVMGGMMASDRRSSGAQIDDQTIELKATARARELAGPTAHVSATSYNRVLLLTGEVPTEADRVRVEEEAARIANVRTVVNELGVMESSSVGSRSGDALITSKVKGLLIDAKDLHANTFKVVTERSVVYLMGRVTAAEADLATKLARSANGVAKVVRVFEIATAAELTAQ